MSKKSFFKTFLIFSLLIFASLFTACEVEWFGGLEDDLDEKLTNTVYFYIENPDTSSLDPNIPIEKKYMIGTRLTQEDFPQNGSAELYALRPGYTITPEWKSTSTELGTDFLYTVTDNVVSYLTVPPKEKGVAKLYLNTTDWHPNTNTPFTVHYELQNIYDDGNTPETIQEEGQTDDNPYVHQIHDYASYKVDDACPFERASIHDSQFHINGDGSTVVNLTLDRKKVIFTFQLNSSDPNQGWTTTPDECDDGIKKNVKEASRYKFTRRFGYAYNKLELDKLIPYKTGWGFYGWNYDNRNAIECLDTQNPYDFVQIDPFSELNQEMTQTDSPTFYPVWGPDFHKVFVCMDQMKDDEFIGEIPGINILTDENGKKYINMSSATQLQPPTLPSSYNTSDFEFKGYSFATALLPAVEMPLDYDSATDTYSIGNSLLASFSENGILYARWTYKNIYLDPVYGDDDNDGLSVGTAVKSVLKAKELAKDGITDYSGNSIYLMNKITQISDLEQLNNISLGTYHNVSIKRAEGVKGTLIEIPSGYTKIWTYITFDGNNDKVTATSPFIVNYGELTLKQSISFKNISSDGTVLMGSVVNNKNKLTIGGYAGTLPTKFNNIISKKGGLFCNDDPNAEFFLDYSTEFTSCTCESGATGLAQRANIAYIRQGTLILRDKTFGSSSYISVNKDATIQHNANINSGVIASLILGDESATGTLSDFDATMSYQLLTRLSTSISFADVASCFNIPDSTYNPSTSTAGWKIDENGKLVYATFGGGVIRIPTNFIAKFGVIFNSTSDGSLYASNPSSPVITLSSPDFEIGITIKLWYDSETDANQVIFASNNVIRNITDPDFQNYTAKIYYSSVETPAILNSNGKLEGSADWPEGEYNVYIYFEYMGVPYSIYIPFTVDY